MSKPSKPLTGLLTWERVEQLVDKIRALGPWYIFSPAQGRQSLFVAQGGEAADFLADRSEVIKTRRHGAGWIYVHTPDAPSWIKIYDPMKCGSSCSMTTPDAWWEMALEDPGEKLKLRKETPENKGLLNWIKETKISTKKN